MPLETTQEGKAGYRRKRGRTLAHMFLLGSLGWDAFWFPGQNWIGQLNPKRVGVFISSLRVLCKRHIGIKQEQER